MQAINDSAVQFNHTIEASEETASWTNLPAMNGAEGAPHAAHTAVASPLPQSWAV